MPFILEPLVRVARTEFPERCIPRCAVPCPHARACRNQPALNHFPKKAVLDESFAVNAAEVVRSEDTSTAALQLFQNVQRFGQFFVWCWHGDPCPARWLQAYRVV